MMQNDGPEIRKKGPRSSLEDFSVGFRDGANSMPYRISGDPDDYSAGFRSATNKDDPYELSA